MSKRYFEFVDGKSNKFWEVWMEGAQVLTRYGKIGANGAVTTKDEGTPEKAQKLYDKLVKEKTGKGYAEKAAQVVAEAPPLDEAALAGHLKKLETAEGDDAFAVFADWLQSAGHPWGRLIANQQAQVKAGSAQRAELEKEEKTLLREHGGVLTGNLQSVKGTSFEWENGFIRTAVVCAPGDGAQLAKNLEVLLGLPTARLLHTLVLDPSPETLTTYRDWDSSPDNIVEGFVEVLAKVPNLPPRITTIALGALEPSPASAYVALPAFSLVNKALARFPNVFLTGSIEGPTPLDLPNVRRLEVRFASADGGALTTLASSTLPKLEHVSVSLGGIANCVLDDAIPARDWDEDDEDALRYPATFPVSTLSDLEVYDLERNVSAADVARFLAAKWPVSLTSLGITHALLDDEMVWAIADSPLLKSLTALDLAGGALSKQSAASLIKAKDRFSHLKTLNLERNLLPDDVAKQVKEALPNATVGKQREGSEPDFFMRYVATME